MTLGLCMYYNGTWILWARQPAVLEARTHLPDLANPSQVTTVGKTLPKSKVCLLSAENAFLLHAAVVKTNENEMRLNRARKVATSTLRHTAHA